jgi:shikimate 5-dehydrogenase
MNLEIWDLAIAHSKSVTDIVYSPLRTPFQESWYFYREDLK